MSTVSAEPDPPQTLAAVRRSFRALGLTDYEAWINYLNCGGNGDYLEFEAYLTGALVMPEHEWLTLVHTVWEAGAF